MVENAAVSYMMSMDFIDVASEKAGTKNPEIEHIDENNFILWEEIEKLPDPEKTLIHLFYIDGLKQNAISEKLNFSKSKICRLHSQVLSKLRIRLNNRYRKEPT